MSNKLLNFYQNNKKTAILVGGMVLLLVGTIYSNIVLKNKNFKVIAPPIENKPPKPIIIENKLSRISFFHRMEYKGSLAIPESWEGRYRMKEGGDTVFLNYANNPELEDTILYIKAYDKNKWNEIKKQPNVEEQEIGSAGNFVFTYLINPRNPYKGSDKEQFEKMTKEAEEIIKSFKYFILD